MPSTANANGKLLAEACFTVDFASVDRLLRVSDVSVNVNFEDGYPLRTAARLLRLAMPCGEPTAQCGILRDIVMRLLQDPRSDPGISAFRDSAMKHIAGCGDSGLVDALLAHTSVDPTLVLAEVAACGHIALLEQLLAHARVDPGGRESLAMRAAAAHGHVEALELLLADPRVDPAAQDNAAIVLAAKHGRLAVVERLLSDPRVDPTAGSHAALHCAAELGRLPVVRRLLADPRVDPAACNAEASVVEIHCDRLHNDVPAPAAEGGSSDHGLTHLDAPAAACSPLLRAVVNGRGTVVAALLADSRVDPAACDNEAIVQAASYLRSHVVQLLAADPRVDPSARNNTAMRLALYDRSGYIVTTLLAQDAVCWALRQPERAAPDDDYRLLADLAVRMSSGQYYQASALYLPASLLSATLRSGRLRPWPSTIAAVARWSSTGIAAAAWCRRRAAVLARLRVMGAPSLRIGAPA